MFVRSLPDSKAYAYLLGIYLGDGYLAFTGRSWQLVISLDSAYPGIVDECATAIRASSPGVSAHVRTVRGTNTVRIDSGSKSWPELFPQHGPGRKHERSIVLADWQLTVVRRHTALFIRGLIHSDGCRSVNRFKTKLPSGRIAEYAYPRYFFTNASADIRTLFCDACDRLGIRWTRSNARNISVAHRPSVALLDTIVGPKT
jgi:hypothetical protein